MPLMPALVMLLALPLSVPMPTPDKDALAFLLGWLPAPKPMRHIVVSLREGYAIVHHSLRNS